MCKSNIETAYLIVGANGFVGSYMIKNILEKTNKKILALDCDILGKENTDRLEWIKCDVTDQSDIEKVNLKCSEYRDYLGAQPRFKHLFKPEYEYLIEEWQKRVFSLQHQDLHVKQCNINREMKPKLFYLTGKV